MSAWVRAAAVVALGATIGAQAPDGDAVLRGAGVSVPRGGAEAAFDQGLAPPSPIPPGAFATLVVGMGPVGTSARVRSAYAFGVLAGRSGKTVPPAEMASAGVLFIQMILAQDRRVRIAGARVAGRVYANPIGGGSGPQRPAGLQAAIFAMLNQPDETEQLAAMEALGLLEELAAVPALAERYAAFRKQNRRAAAGAALEALTRIGDPAALPLVKALVGDRWGDRDDATGLAVAYAREKFLKDGSLGRLQVAATDRTRGPQARTYLAELGVAQ
jgi:hypothetical protein